ncbi:hypothetical protein H480_09658, partial [Amycolatopsis vancoresmycina DSM 44592]
MEHDFVDEPRLEGRGQDAAAHEPDVLAAGRLAGRARARGADRVQRRGQDVLAQQRFQRFRQQRRLVGQDGEVELEVDAGAAGLGERGFGRRLRRADERAAADLAD